MGGPPGPRRRRRRALVGGHGAGPGARAGGPGRPGVVGQEHVPHQPRRRLVLLPRRDRHHPGADRGHARGRPLRLLHPVPGGLPHRRLPGALRPRRAPLHLLPDDRAEGVHSPGAARRRRRLGPRLRHLPGGLPVEPARPGRGGGGLPPAAGPRPGGPRGAAGHGPGGLQRALPPQPRQAPQAPGDAAQRRGLPRQRRRPRGGAAPGAGPARGGGAPGAGPRGLGPGPTRGRRGDAGPAGGAGDRETDAEVLEEIDAALAAAA